MLSRTASIRTIISQSSRGHSVAAGWCALSIALASCSGGGSDGGGGTPVPPPPPPPPPAENAYYLPYFGVSGDTYDPGIFLIRSDNPQDIVDLPNVDADPWSSIFIERAVTDSQGNIQKMIPSLALMRGAANPANIFALDLEAKTSAIPAPSTIGKLPGTAPVNCGGALAEHQANDPKSTLIFRSTPGADNTCGTSDDQYYLSHASDDANTLAKAVPLGEHKPFGGFVSVYDQSSKDLTGLVYMDRSNNLSFSDPDFSNPKVLLSGITRIGLLMRLPGYVFIVAGTESQASIYRVDCQGSISSDLYDYQASSLPNAAYALAPRSAAADTADGVLWFSDNGGTFTGGYNDLDGKESAYSIKLARVPLDGSSVAQVIYSDANTLPSTFDRAHYVVEPAGFVDSRLVFVEQSSDSYQQEAEGGVTMQAPASMMTLPADAAPGTAPALLASLFGDFYPVRIVGDRIFCTFEALDADGNELSSDINLLNIDGTVDHSIPSAAYLGARNQVSETVQNPHFSTPNYYIIQNPNGGTPNWLNYTDGLSYWSVPQWGGFAVQALSATEFSVSPIVQSDGTAYVLATGDRPEIAEDSDDVMAVSLTNFENCGFPACINLSGGVLDTVHNQWRVWSGLQPFSRVPTALESAYSTNTGY